MNITEVDVLGPIREPMKDGRLVRMPGDKVKFGGQVAPQEAFTLHKNTEWHRCYMWLDMWFPYYKIIPSPCHECYKVVVRPRSLDELFKLYTLQQKMDLPSKCGIEPREEVDALYGGYFYNKGLEAGRECYEKVKTAVAEAISPDVDIYLKRACTEFENDFGRSDKWTITEEQVALEKRLNDVFIAPQLDGVPTPLEKIRNVNLWIKWAAQRGDKAYLNYTNGKPFYPRPVTYHEVTK